MTPSQSPPSYFNKLPEELIVKIFSYLTTTELVRHVIPVCEKWKRTAVNFIPWSHIYFTGKQCVDVKDDMTFSELKKAIRAGFLIKFIKLYACSIVESTSIIEFCIEKKVAIEELHLDRCQVLTSILKDVIKLCPTLHTLTLSLVWFISIDFHVRKTMQCIPMCVKIEKTCKTSLTALTNVDVDRCFLDSLPIIKLLPVSIKTFSYSGTSVTQRRLHTIGKRMPNLTELRLDSCHVTDDGLFKFLTLCSQLQKLTISDTGYIILSGENWLLYIIENPTLRYVSIASCVIPEDILIKYKTSNILSYSEEERTVVISKDPLPVYESNES